MNFRTYLLLLLLSFTLPGTLLSQTHKIDSLRQRCASSSIQIQKEALLKLCEENYSLSGDSLAVYVNKGLQRSAPQDSYFFQFKTYYSMYFLKLDKSKEAVHYIDSLYNNYRKQHKADAISREMKFYLGIAQVRNNEYKEAIQTALKLLDETEDSGDTLGTIRACNVIGWANMELENELEATKWLSRGMRYTNNDALLQKVSALYTNMASCYNVLGKFDTALYFVNKGLAYGKAAENLTVQANGLNIRAAIHSHLNKPADAVKDLEDALAIRKKIGDMYYIISDMALLSHYYAYIGQPTKGISMAQQGIALAKQSGNTYKLIYLQKGLANNYEAAHQYKERGDVLVSILNLKDSLYEKNTEDAIADIKTKYEVQKQENIIIHQQHALLQNKYFTIATIIAMILGAIIFWLAYRNIKHVQKRNMEKMRIEEKMQSLLAVQQAEEKERKRIAADLHDNLGAYAAAISSNIRHLKEEHKIKDQHIAEQLDENAQGIVNQLSDTIWILKNEHLPVTKLADRFKAWAQKLIANYPTIQYEYREHIENDIELTPQTVLNIFLILKECLNNSLKHSACTSIFIEVESSSSLCFRIKDNGIGFQANQPTVGLGIHNMKHRAQACECDIQWTQHTPSGTIVTLTRATTN